MTDKDIIHLILLRGGIVKTYRQRLLAAETAAGRDSRPCALIARWTPKPYCSCVTLCQIAIPLNPMAYLGAPCTPARHAPALFSLHQFAQSLNREHRAIDVRAAAAVIGSIAEQMLSRVRTARQATKLKVFENCLCRCSARNT